MDKYKYKLLCPLFILSPLFLGVYHEWISCFYALALFIYLIIIFVKEGELFIPKTLTLVAAAAVVLFMCISFLWGVDKGMSLVGMFKFLPLPLFAVAIAQTNTEERDRMLSLVPIAGAIMAPASALLGLIPALKNIFYVNGRLAGTFQYPNAFAIYLLSGAVILLFKTKFNKKDIFCLLSLLTGIIFTGSRTVFVLLAAAAVLFLIFTKIKWARLIFAGTVLALSALAALYLIITKNFSVIGRFLEISPSESTFLGRLLYFQDALPVILKHPLGLGYLGYHYLQNSFKTGIYNVVNIHNELLQVLLDVGWVPAVTCIAALLHRLWHCDWRERALIFVICFHCMLDFDLQFISIGFLLILVMDLHVEKSAVVKKNPVIIGAAAFSAVASCYFAIATGAYYLKQYPAAAKIYPAYTDAYLQMLPEAKTVPEMEALADKVLRFNKSVALPYSAKARAAYSRGNFGEMIRQKQQALKILRYSLAEYIDYFDMLMVGAELYEKNGDMASALYCRNCILEIPRMMQDVLNNTSLLGWKIDVKPYLELPEEYEEILEKLNLMEPISF